MLIKEHDVNIIQSQGELNFHRKTGGWGGACCQQNQSHLRGSLPRLLIGGLSKKDELLNRSSCSSYHLNPPHHCALSAFACSAFSSLSTSPTNPFIALHLYVSTPCRSRCRTSFAPLAHHTGSVAAWRRASHGRARQQLLSAVSYGPVLGALLAQKQPLTLYQLPARLSRQLRTKHCYHHLAARSRWRPRTHFQTLLCPSRSLSRMSAHRRLLLSQRVGLRRRCRVLWPVARPRTSQRRRVGHGNPSQIVVALTENSSKN